MRKVLNVNLYFFKQWLPRGQIYDSLIESLTARIPVDCVLMTLFLSYVHCWIFSSNSFETLRWNQQGLQTLEMCEVPNPHWLNVADYNQNHKWDLRINKSMIMILFIGISLSLFENVVIRQIVKKYNICHFHHQTRHDNVLSFTTIGEWKVSAIQ